MQHSINISISPDELKDMMKEVVHDELKVVNNVLSSILISASEARKHLGIKSHNTLMAHVRDGRLKNHAEGNERPKFSLSEIIELKKSRYV